MKAINVIFDGPPSHESGRFVEVETDEGVSVGVGEWIDRGDGYWALRITKEDIEDMKPPYACKFCGLPSWVDPFDQSPPVDYCHPSDHSV